MKVLVLSQYFWPETFRITEVAKSLHDLGCEVTVLTGQPNYPDGAVFPGYSAASVGIQIHDGLTIHRVPLVPRGRGSALLLVLNYLSFIVSAAVFGPWLLRGERVDVILVYAPSPILQVIPAVWLKWIKGAKLVTWVQDLWPESLSATGFVRSPKILGTVASVVRWIYRKNNLLLVQSQAFVSPVRVMAGDTPVLYHPNPGEQAIFQPQVFGSPALVLAPGFNIVFAGNLGTVQALDTVLDAAELLLPQAGVRFVLVGSGSRSVWLQQEVMRRGLSNVQLPGRYAPEAMPGILAQASALLVSLTRSPIMGQTVPSKVQAYLAAGKPVIASMDGEGARVIEEAGAGVTCAAEDSAALAAAVLQLNELPADALKRMGETAQAYYAQHFDPAALAKKLVQYFSELVAARK
jgi:glycosyltransferase involved in cell wall biosynthesis